jgi:hypothetical protein
MEFAAVIVFSAMCCRDAGAPKWGSTMGYREDFSKVDGWSVADVSVRLNNSAGRTFLTFLRSKSVHTLVRYYAS